MTTSNYRKGYLFERKVAGEIQDIIRTIHPKSKVYVMTSRGSHGLADLLCHVSTGQSKTCFAIQCKRRKPSVPSMKRMIAYARKEYDMLLFFAFSEDGVLTFYPDLIKYLYSLEG